MDYEPNVNKTRTIFGAVLGLFLGTLLMYTRSYEGDPDVLEWIATLILCMIGGVIVTFCYSWLQFFFW